MPTTMKDDAWNFDGRKDVLGEPHSSTLFSGHYQGWSNYVLFGCWIDTLRHHVLFHVILLLIENFWSANQRSR